MRDTEIVTKLLKPYRAKRTTPRPDGTMEDNAPPWAAMLAARLASSVGRNGEHMDLMTRVLAWCAAGEPVSRATQVIGLMQFWKGGHVERLLASFLLHNKHNHGGRPAGASVRRIGVPYVPESWDEVDEMAAFNPLSDEVINVLARNIGDPAECSSEFLARIAKEIQFNRQKRRMRISGFL